MKTYNFFYNGMPITKQQFLQSVPFNWDKDVIDGEFSYGYYKAIENN